MKVKRRDLDPDQVNRMMGVYGMSYAQVLDAAQAIVDPKERTNRQPPKPSRRGRRFNRQSRK